MLIIAHRGASAYAPENTGPAFLRAIALQADGVELDVHLSADGEIVVNHNFTLDENSNGSGFIYEHTLDQLKALDFGSWKGPDFGGARLLTLEEALILVRGMRVINIEIKAGEKPYNGLPQKVCEVVERMGLAEKVIVSSFNHQVAMEAKRCLPAVKAGLLYDKPITHPSQYAAKLGADAIHPHSRLLNRRQVQECLDRGLQVNVWTVDNPARARTLQSWGCTAVITNQPDVIRDALQAQ